MAWSHSNLGFNVPRSSWIFEGLPLSSSYRSIWSQWRYSQAVCSHCSIIKLQSKLDAYTDVTVYLRNLRIRVEGSLLVVVISGFCFSTRPATGRARKFGVWGRD